MLSLTRFSPFWPASSGSKRPALTLQGCGRKINTAGIRGRQIPFEGEVFSIPPRNRSPASCRRGQNRQAICSGSSIARSKRCVENDRPSGLRCARPSRRPSSRGCTSVFSRAVANRLTGEQAAALDALLVRPEGAAWFQPVEAGMKSCRARSALRAWTDRLFFLAFQVWAKLLADVAHTRNSASSRPRPPFMMVTC